MQQRSPLSASLGVEGSPVPVHFGAHLRLLRDRHGLGQAEIVKYLETWKQAAYSKVETGTRAPLFEQLEPIYRALKQAGVQLTIQDREHFYLLARDLLESRQRRHTHRSEKEWNAFYARLAAIDGYPITKAAPPPSQLKLRKRMEQTPRREVGHLLGREAWLASLIERIVGPSPMKVLVLKGPPGCGKTSELHRLANHFLQHIPRYYAVISEPSPIQLGRLGSTDILEQLLEDILGAVGPAYAMMPTSSLQARVNYILDTLAKADRPVVIGLDNAEHIFERDGNLEKTWQSFLIQFAQASHEATLIVASQEWPMGTFLSESQLMVMVDVPVLSEREGSQLLQTLGLRNVPEELLLRAVDAVGGMPICIEWMVRLIREPYLREEWTDEFEEADDGAILAQLLDDPAIFGGAVAQRVQPLLERVLKRLSNEAAAALQDLAVSLLPLGAPALKVLYQSPKVLRELREASLLVAYPQRVQLLPMVAAQVRQTLTDAQVIHAEDRLIQALSQWLHTGIFHQRESGNIIVELATFQLKHERMLEAAHLLVRYGWAAFNLGHGPRLARLIQEKSVESHYDGEHNAQIAYQCGRIVLKHYLAPFSSKADGRFLESDYYYVLTQILAGKIRVQPSFEVHILHRLMLCAINAKRFEDAQRLFDGAFERLSPYLAGNGDLHASLLERQAYLAGRWGDWLKEHGEQDAAHALLDQALALYQQCTDLLAVEENRPDLERSIRQKRRARILNSLGYRLNGFGRYEEAKRVIEQSILLKKQGFTEIGALASSYGEMAQAQAGLGCFQEAFRYNDLALEEVRRLARAGHKSSQEELWVYLVERGKLFWLIGRPDQAEQLLSEAKPHIDDRRSAFRMMAQRILGDIKRWKDSSSSTEYQLDWRWIEDLRQWVSFPLYEWLDPAGSLTLEEQQQMTALFPLETEEAREQKHMIIRRSLQRVVDRALREQSNPEGGFTYPAIPLERVKLHIKMLRDLDGRILKEEPNRWVREWYHGAIEEHLSLLSMVEAAAAADDVRFWSVMQHLYPKPSEAEQHEVIAYVRQILLQASLKKELKEAAQQAINVFTEQFGITFDVSIQSEEERNVSVARPLTPSGDTGKLVSAQVAKQFFERIFNQQKYAGWQVMLSAHASNPYADSPSRRLVLPIVDQSVKQILSIYEHAVLDHVESTVAGEQSRLGLLGIGLPEYTLSREGSALYQQRRAAEESGKPFDDSTIWAGAFGIVLACRVVDSSRAFFWVYSGLQQVFYLYRCLRRPDQDEEVAREKAGEIALKYCLQLYRGKSHLDREGCWTKPVVYLRGLQLVERAIAKDPAVLEYLSLGKMAIEHIPLLQDLQVLPSKETQSKREKEKQSAEALLLLLAEESS